MFWYDGTYENPSEVIVWAEFEPATFQCWFLVRDLYQEITEVGILREMIIMMCFPRKQVSEQVVVWLCHSFWSDPKDRT